MSAFQEAMRRVITGDDAQGKSVIIIDGENNPIVHGGRECHFRKYPQNEAFADDCGITMLPVWSGMG